MEHVLISAPNWPRSVAMATLVKYVLVSSLKSFCYKQLLASTRSLSARTFSISSQSLSGRKYSDKHEWVKVDDKIGTVGISQYAQEALGDIVYAELPDVGSEFNKHDECGTLESVKAATEVYTPVSGTVCDKNSDVESEPALVNKSPYEKGWLFKIELKDPKELDELMTEEDYQAYLKEQE